MLPEMLKSIATYTNHIPVIAAAPSISIEKYQTWANGFSVQIIAGETYQLLAHAQAALVTSGTATLETALFMVPEVVLYKGGKISYWLARRLIKVRFISLVNLILDRMVVKELIQSEMNESKIREYLDAILYDGNNRTSMLKDYEELRKQLGGIGASERTAKDMVERLKLKD
jgi:lipid-A-disaccharide synthase